MNIRILKWDNNNDKNVGNCVWRIFYTRLSKACRNEIVSFGQCRNSKKLLSLSLKLKLMFGTGSFSSVGTRVKPNITVRLKKAH